jgi:MarR family 2-MHQ and catechol resistance regulon transcriptional repressor
MSHDPSHFSQRLALLTYGRVMRAANTLRNFASRQLSETGLTLTQFAVLEALYHVGPMSLTEVARKILTTGGNLTMVVGNLEKQGLVKRKCSAEDARVYVLTLTAKGKRLIETIFPEHARAITKQIEVLLPKEQKKLSDLCKKLAGSHPEL